MTMSSTAYAQPLREVAPAPPRVSPLAVGDGSLRRGRARTLPVYGVCVHTTGSGPALKAKGRAKTPLQIAHDYYVHGGEGFPHYLIGYDGTIHAICDEAHVAWHAGWKGGRSRWASWTAPAWWKTVWSRWNATTPANLLPSGASSPNEVYVGVELLGDETGWGFTAAQYDALGRLVADVGRRYGIAFSTPPNPRLLGHEDVEPIARSNAQGGWDPGAHRTNPKFSWATLWARLQAARGGGPTPPSTGIVTAFADAVRRAFGGDGMIASVIGVAEAAAAFARGERDVNRLTDVIFHARHRERGGRRIARGETRLAREWLWIRDQVVAPALRHVAAASPVPAPAAVGAPTAAQFGRGTPSSRRWAALVPLLDRHRGDIPLDFLLGWIAVESDGRIDVVTSLDERGFFQIHPDESRDARPPIQHARLSTDPDYSIQAGVQVVRRYADLARQRFPWIRPGTELFWRVVKLQHAMGSPLARRLLNELHSKGVATTWDAIKRFEVSDGPRMHRLLAVRPGRFGANVDHVVERGRATARSLGR